MASLIQSGHNGSARAPALDRLCVAHSSGLIAQPQFINLCFPGGFHSMSQDEFEGGKGNEQDHEHEHEHEVEEALEEALELDTQSQIFLVMRRQNLDLLRIATQVAGYSGQHGPVKSGDVKNAMRNIWEVFSEFYSWIDPEEAEGDEEDEDEDDDEDAE